MIIKASAPCRISLFGGGTDVEPFASNVGGITVSFAVNLRERFTFFTQKDMYGQYKDEFPYNATPKFIYDIFHENKIGGGHLIKITGKSDAFLGSGLGTSAAAAVATVAAINRIKELGYTRDQIAQKAWDAENHMGWYGGKQDQYAATYGGFNIFEFSENGVKVKPFKRHLVESLRDGMILFYTGEKKKKDIQEQLKEPTEKQMNALLDIKEMAVGSLPYIMDADWKKVGKLLDIYWKHKKESNEGVSNDKIDEIYAAAKKAGALGGKLLGAGSGGYMLFMVDPAIRQSFFAEMAKVGMENIDFSIDWNGVDTRIL